MLWHGRRLTVDEAVNNVCFRMKGRQSSDNLVQ